MARERNSPAISASPAAVESLAAPVSDSAPGAEPGAAGPAAGQPISTRPTPATAREGEEMSAARRSRRAGSPDTYLHKATHAQSSEERAKYATRGLSQPGLDETTHAMLLRQLYLAHMEARRFELALEVSSKMIELQVLPDAARQDAARACMGLMEHERAVEHLRIAGRVAPASRRAFHAWTLGSTLYLLGRCNEAISALERAVRWATSAKPLYLAQLALARIANEEPVPEDLEDLRDTLRDAPSGQGYGQFVLGELAAALGDHDEARRCLRGFIKRTSAGRVALAVGLSAELDRARDLLQQLGENTAAG
jgi:tetratricopeptide (TPR) repeat protein